MKKKKPCIYCAGGGFFLCDLLLFLFESKEWSETSTITLNSTTFISIKKIQVFIELGLFFLRVRQGFAMFAKLRGASVSHDNAPGSLPARPAENPVKPDDP